MFETEINLDALFENDNYKLIDIFVQETIPLIKNKEVFEIIQGHILIISNLFKDGAKQEEIKKVYERLLIDIKKETNQTFTFKNL